MSLTFDTTELKQFLFSLPADNDFKFSVDVRKQIRAQLFKSISNQCKYMNWFFPKAFDDEPSTDAPEVLQAKVMHKLDTLFDFSYDKYYKTNVHNTQTKYDSHDHHAFHSGVPCSRIFRKGEPIYRCLTCGYDDTCALCSHCFQTEFHADHNVHIAICSRENGGVCDCGDPEAWINEFHCPFATQDENSQRFAELSMPPDLEMAYLSTIGTVLDYVIDVMTHSDLQYSNPNDITSTFIEKYSENSSLDSLRYGFREEDLKKDTNTDEFSLMVYNDQNRHYREAVQRIRLASRKVYEFAVMVTEKAQEYGKAKVISSADIALLQERQKVLAATGLATSIRSNRDIFREDMCDEILLWINALTDSEMFKISNTAKNLFCQAFCCRWQKGLTDQPNILKELSYNIGCLDSHYEIPKKIPKLNSGKFPNSEEENAPAHWRFEPKLWNIDDELCSQCDYNLSLDDYDPEKNHHGSRFQYMVYLDTRFWTSIRFALHDMYSTSLIVNLKYKRITSSQYVDIYPMVTGIYLLKDREPEINIMATLSTQLFTCPSNSTAIMEHGDLSRIFAGIYGFFTEALVMTPETMELTHSISMKSLRNRRWGQMFFDIGYILSRSRYSEVVLSPEVIAMACDFLCLLHGRPVLKREGKNHVEFENPEYSSFFQSAPMIYQFAESTAHCLNNRKAVPDAQTEMLSNQAIAYVFRFILNLEHNRYPGLTDTNIDIDLSSERPHKFRIDSGKVSFLHPLHSFISWLLEAGRFKSIEQVGEILETEANNYTQTVGIPGDPLVLFEYPIRTIVLMSQIKSGFWVRNGYGVRSQPQLYKNTGLRESGYMRDLFLIQLFSNLYAPDLVCYTILDRWLLLDGWVQKVAENNVPPRDSMQAIVSKTDDQSVETLAYDLKTLSYMIEECSNFFIHLLTEDLYLRGLPADVVGRIRVETEIIQNLCFGPMSYTKLCSQIPEHIVAEKRFDIILDDLTIFTPPNTSKDFGSYRLKDIYFSRVNPYFFNYSTNTRDDAIKLVKEKISNHKKPKIPEVITPELRSGEELGIYKYVGNFSISSYFSKFLVTSLLYVDVMGVEKTDSLLEVLLHLIHICSFENRLDVNKHGSFFDVFTNRNDTTTTADASISELLYKFLLEETYKAHHAKIKAIFFKLNETYDVTSIMSTKIANFDFKKVVIDDTVGQAESDIERKKRVAKDKQAKLMAKFKKQQSSFLKNNDISNAEVDDIEMMDTDDDGWYFPESHCILCQDESNKGPFGIAAYVSKSSEFWSLPFDDKYWFLKSFSDGSNLDEDEIEEGDNEYTKNWMNYMNKIKEENVIGPGFTSHENVNRKLVSSSCGHGMHFNCYLNFLNNRSKQNQITRNSPDNYEHKEFLCPLCKAINNSFIPILWKNNKRQLKGFLDKAPVNDLFDVFDTLKHFETSKHQFFEQFKAAIKTDVESMSILTPTFKEIINTSGSGNPMDTQQRSFLITMGHSLENLQNFYFPELFKTDSSQLLTNTIKSTEISLRGESSKDALVISQLTNNTLINLRTVAEYRNTATFINLKGPEAVARDVYIKQLACLQSLYLTPKFNKKVLEQDFFELLVGMLPLPSAGFSFNVILKATFTGHLVQTVYLLIKNLLSHDFYNCSEYSILDVPIISSLDEEKAEIATKLFKKARSFLLLDADELVMVNDPKFGFVFYSMLVKATTPFLRRAAIYAYILCPDMAGVDYRTINSLHLESDRLCHLLNLDPLHLTIQKFIHESSSFESTKFSGFFRGFSSTPRNEELAHRLEYPGLIKLINLPDRLDYFFSKYYYSDKYDKPHLTIEDPAICLFCAEVMDIQKCAIGSPLGTCTTHVLKECPNNIGIFLLPKDKTILVLHKNGGSFMEAPYLDSHGELAVESKRNNTLHLMKPRYNGLVKNVWLGHNIPNYIVRKLDHVIDAGGWDTL